MSILLESRIARTLTGVVSKLVESAERSKCPNTQAVWLFDPAETRRRAQAELAEAAIDIGIHSAYKPLLHAFLEDIDLDGVETIDVAYPVVCGVAASRFLLECYPVDALTGGRPITFTELPTVVLEAHGCEVSSAEPKATPALPPLRYIVTLKHADGDETRVQVPAPNRWATDCTGVRVLRNCGWHDGPLITDLEQAFDSTLEAIARYPWKLGTSGPFFDCLSISLCGPFAEQALPAVSEAISLAEVMHEEFYFAGLELFAHLLGLPPGSRELSPGQIVPQMYPRSSATDGHDHWHLHVAIENAPPLDHDEHPRVKTDAEATTATAGAAESLMQAESGTAVAHAPAFAAETLANAAHWLMPDEIEAHLNIIGGAAGVARSHRGRRVSSRHVTVAGLDAPAVALSAGQHANETTGPVGVLRAAYQLRSEALVNFVVTPLLNPDGYALFRDCCKVHAGHMHHAARYTALGNDLVWGSPDFETGALHSARHLSGAELHVNCHGYPSHEWTRPLSGYLPRGFEHWTIPKGFFLIMRYAPGYRDAAMIIIGACIQALNDYPPVMTVNTEQLARHARYHPGRDVDIRQGVPIYMAETSAELFPLTLITEAPDETVYGDRFRVLHEAQRRVILAAVRAHASAGQVRAGTGRVHSD